MVKLNIDNQEVEIDYSKINNEEELEKLNDEINKQGTVEFNIQD